MKISGSADFIYKTRITYSTREPLLKDDSQEFSCNTLIVQNPGNRMVIADAGFTIAPGGQFVIGSENNDPYAKFEQTIKFCFVGDPIGGTCYDHDRLEFLEVHLNVCGCIPCKKNIQQYIK